MQREDSNHSPRSEDVVVAGRITGAAAVASGVGDTAAHAGQSPSWFGQTMARTNF